MFELQHWFNNSMLKTNRNYSRGKNAIYNKQNAWADRVKNLLKQRRDNAIAWGHGKLLMDNLIF